MSDFSSICHGFTRSRLEAEYDVERSIPDFPGYMSQFAQASDRTRERHATRQRLDQRYGDRPAERMDIYLPEGEGPAPIVVFLHGGAWKGSNKEGRAFPADFVCRHGAIWISLEYPLAPDHDLDDIVASVTRGLRWVLANAATFGGRADRVLVSGHSAGAHLATMAVFSLDPAERQDLRLMTLSGVFDMTPLMFTKANGWLRLDLEAAKRNSPITNIPAVPPPLTALVGSDEPSAFIHQTLDMAVAWARAGTAPEVVVLPGRNHFSVLEEYQKDDSPVCRTLLSFIRS